ncbi:hypothetical protein NHX12_027229 [Muraenolepis orangiensis]|uniref:AAA+ ATPase domain-containing protein n=1 Tax=Muraenolepis orangiensis TaxID=630683 RepID=A0A9Q0ED69_9TELE|nr:hypothetical protein NHX12_027229 [Muraenolepis orangiensis]
MMDLSYLKTAHQTREAEELRTETRKKDLLILIYHHLLEQGVEVCDNVDLETVLMEYQTYHYVKFNKYPKLTRRTAHSVETRLVKSCAKKRTPCSTVKPLPRINPAHRPHSGGGAKKSEPKMDIKDRGTTGLPDPPVEFGLNVSSIATSGAPGEASSRKLTDNKAVIHQDTPGRGVAADPNHMERLLKPLGTYLPNICPIEMTPGKTLLAKAVATECNSTFFNISASTITSKWRGDSEKLIRVLFELAKYHAPSTIFLDEVESVMGQRGGTHGVEHEGSRRMKTELLIQMDGLAASDHLVFLLAASNLPWELDQAMLRRLEKRILIGLPSEPARQAMISHWLPPVSCPGGVELRTQLDYGTLAKEAAGYSGSDLRLVCKESAMRPVRKILHTLETPGQTDRQTDRHTEIQTDTQTDRQTHRKTDRTLLYPVT